MASNDVDKETKERILELVIAEKRRLICSSRAVRIVEQYSNKNVTRHFLCKTLNLIERAHWDDAVDERNGEGLCGYVFCSSKPLLTEGKRQQYRICARTNRVYDMEEYNKFCSVQCFKRSNHIKQQIPETSIVSRDVLETINVDLLEENKLNTSTSSVEETGEPAGGQPVLSNDAEITQSSNQTKNDSKIGKKPFSYSKTKKPEDDAAVSPLMGGKDAVRAWITDNTIKWLNNEALTEKPNLEEDQYQQKVNSFLGRRWMTRGKEEKDDAENLSNSIHIPLVDSFSQNSIRKRIVLDKLSNCLHSLLPQMKISLNTVTPVLKSAVNTFSLTSTNIVLRPAQWNVATLLLLKVIAKREEEIRLALETSEGVALYSQFLDDNADFITEELIGNDYFTVD